LTNLQGLAADYKIWKKLPYRDPNERIARYGPGFSKILTNMRSNDQFVTKSSPGRNIALEASTD